MCNICILFLYSVCIICVLFEIVRFLYYFCIISVFFLQYVFTCFVLFPRRGILKDLLPPTTDRLIVTLHATAEIIVNVAVFACWGLESMKYRCCLYTEDQNQRQYACLCMPGLQTIVNTHSLPHARITPAPPPHPLCATAASAIVPFEQHQHNTKIKQK